MLSKIEGLILHLNFTTSPSTAKETTEKMATSWAYMSLDERRGHLQSFFQNEHQSHSASIRQELAAIEGKIAAAEKDLEQHTKCALTTQARREADEMADGIMNMREEADTLDIELKDHEAEFFESYVSFLSGQAFDLQNKLRDPAITAEVAAELTAELEAVYAEWREFSTDNEPDAEDDINLQNALCRDLGADI